MKTHLIVVLMLLTQTLAAQTDTAQLERRARILIVRHCADCHAITALKIKGASNIGPDLSVAYAHVPTRYGMPLERFFDQPVGIMKGIFGDTASFPRTARDSLVGLLRDLYNEQLARQDSSRRNGSPVQSKPR